MDVFSVSASAPIAPVASSDSSSQVQAGSNGIVKTPKEIVDLSSKAFNAF